MTPWQPVLDFWFLPPGDPQHGESRQEWWRKDPAFDAEIATRFGVMLEAALAGGLGEWDRDPRGALARIIVLDQFTRNAFRDTPRAYAGDAMAQAATLAMIEREQDRSLQPVERWFAYMPLQHAEDLALQDRSVDLFGALAQLPGYDGALDFAMRHRDIVARFGRFPHRNRILGRVSTPDEIAFLEQPGSSF